MTHLKSVRIGELVAGTQPEASDLLQLRRADFRSIVNLRLDSETTGSVTPEQESGLASMVGMTFTHLPISVDTLSEQDVRNFTAVIADLPAPVYVHCGLGQRAAAMALLSEEQSATEASRFIARAEQRGIAITPRVRNFIAEHFERQQLAHRREEAVFLRAVR